jgi:hypothetical protein
MKARSNGKEETVLKQLMIKTYSNVAQGSCCATPSSCCAPGTNPTNLPEVGRLIGYPDEELKAGLGDMIGLITEGGHEICRLR